MFLAALLLSLVLPQGASAANECPSPVTRNYLRPLKRMPPVREVSPNQRLPFGPSDIRIFSSGGLLAGGGAAGFRLGSIAPDKTHSLSWRIDLDVVRVSASGSTGKLIRSKGVLLNSSRRLEREPLELMAHLGSRKAFYRLDLKIYRGRNLLGQFGEYVRVVPYRVNTRLALSSETAGPGEVIRVRVLNLGTSFLSYGQSILLERREADGWAQLPGSGPFESGLAITIFPGTSGACEAVAVPADQEAGTYRVSKRVSAGRRPFAIRSVFKVR